MRGSRIGLLHAAAAGVVAAASCLPAMATCGSANCFLFTHDQQGLPAPGTLELDLSFRYVDQSRKLSGSESIGEVLAPAVDFENRTLEPDHHRELRTQNTLLQLGLAYGVTERVALVGLLPIVNQRDHEHFDEVGTPDEHFTREDGSSGFGDVQLGARYALRMKSSELLRGACASRSRRARTACATVRARSSPGRSRSTAAGRPATSSSAGRCSRPGRP